VALGVDLGTTNSSIAWSDEGGTVHSLSVRSGKEPFDAVIGSAVLDPLEAMGPAVVGRGAFTASEQRPGAPLLYSFKSRLDKQRLREVAYQLEVVNLGGHDPVTETNSYRETLRRVDLMYDPFSREEVVGAAARILQRLLTSQEIDDDPTAIAPAAASIGRGVLSRFLRGYQKPTGDGASRSASVYVPDDQERLFIGVPVAFGSAARRRLLAALAKSGCFGPEPTCYPEILQRCRLVYEPVAVAASLPIIDPETVLIIDFGGGTLDVALLDVAEDERGRGISERALNGRNEAGDALDEAFRQGVLRDDHALSAAYNRFASGAFGEAAARAIFTQAKIDLSTAESAAIRLPGAEVTVSREQFVETVKPQLDRTIECIRECLAKAGCTAGDVDRIILTGGSSLIPAIQSAIRREFPDLPDDRFAAGLAGNSASERETLTGVSRGLAAFGFLDRFEATAPCRYGVLFAGSAEPIVCLERGAADVSELSQARPIRVSLPKTGDSAVALYGDLVRRSFLGAIAQTRTHEAAEVDIRIATSRDRFAPAFSVHRPGHTEASAVFDLHSLSPEQLESFVQGDDEWLPGDSIPATLFLSRPLRIGDFIEWREGNLSRRGQITKIREIASGQHLEAMSDWDPDRYAVTVHPERNRGIDLATTIQPGLNAWNVRIL
jgi:actin-like ATPase involved in cell morphogenesis